MKVLKYYNELYEIVDYPAVWGKEVKGLQDGIQYFEIMYSEKPIYNPIFQTLKSTYINTGVLGEFLNKVVIQYDIITLSNEIVEQNLNNHVGKHLDSLYEEWERSKHSGISLRFAQKLLFGEQLSEYEQVYLTYIMLTADWCRDCRVLRDNMQTEFEQTGKIISTVFSERPPKII